MKQLTQKILLVGLLISISACSSSLSLLKASPAPDSGFLGDTGVEAKANKHYPFHRIWYPEEARDTLSAPHKIYVAPVDTTHLTNNSIYFNDKDHAKAAIKKDIIKISKYLESTFRAYLEEKVADRFIVVEEPTKDALILELALVELTPTDVARNLLGTVAGVLIPGGGALSIKGQGTVAIEGRLRNAQTGKTLFAFADRESGKMALFSINDFSLYSHARNIIDDWAQQLATVLAISGNVRVADSSPVTLLPI